MRNLTLCEVLAGGAFERVNEQHSGEFDKTKNFKESQMPGGGGGGVGGGGGGGGGEGMGTFVID